MRHFLHFIFLAWWMASLSGCGAHRPRGSGSIPEQKMETAMFNIGQAAENAHNHRYAADMFKKGLDVNPNSMRMREHLAYNYAISGQYPESLKVYEDILSRDPGHEGARLGMAESYLAMQDYAAALASYALFLDHVKEEGMAANGYNGLGIILDRFGQYKEAKVCYQKGLRLHPDSSSIMSNYALSLALSGQIDEALDQLQKTQLQKNSPRLHANLALLKELYVLIEEEKMTPKASMVYLRDSLFAKEKSIPLPIYKRLGRKAVKEANLWCHPSQHGSKSQHKPHNMVTSSLAPEKVELISQQRKTHFKPQALKSTKTKYAARSASRSEKKPMKKKHKPSNIRKKGHKKTDDLLNQMRPKPKNMSDQQTSAQKSLVQEKLGTLFSKMKKKTRTFQKVPRDERLHQSLHPSKLAQEASQSLDPMMAQVSSTQSMRNLKEHSKMKPIHARLKHVQERVHREWQRKLNRLQADAKKRQQHAHVSEKVEKILTLKQSQKVL